jgi:hypothetical protein
MKNLSLQKARQNESVVIFRQVSLEEGGSLAADEALASVASHEERGLWAKCTGSCEELK